MEEIEDNLIPLSARNNKDRITSGKQWREGLENYEKRLVGILEGSLPANYTSDYISRTYRRPMVKGGLREVRRVVREEASRLRRLDIPVVEKELERFS